MRARSGWSIRRAIISAYPEHNLDITRFSRIIYYTLHAKPGKIVDNSKCEVVENVHNLTAKAIFDLIAQTHGFDPVLESHRWAEVSKREVLNCRVWLQHCCHYDPQFIREEMRY